jgi:hypothetical protein
MESFNSKEYQGRIYETKDSFVVETLINESEKTYSIQDPSNFINKQLKEFDGKQVKVELIVKITPLT